MLVDVIFKVAHRPTGRAGTSLLHFIKEATNLRICRFVPLLVPLKAVKMVSEKLIRSLIWAYPAQRDYD